MSLGGVMVHVANQGSRETNHWRKFIAIMHGVGVTLVLVAGFGLLARLGIHWPWPLWVIVKLSVWLVIGAFPTLVYRRVLSPIGAWWVLTLLALIAAMSATYKYTG